MTRRTVGHVPARKGTRLLERLDKMVQGGRLTEDDAARLRSAAERGELDDALRELRLEHARAAVEAAVDDGRLTQDEAHAAFDRLDSGEDPGFLRGLRRGLRRRGSDG